MEKQKLNMGLQSHILLLIFKEVCTSDFLCHNSLTIGARKRRQPCQSGMSVDSEFMTVMVVVSPVPGIRLEQLNVHKHPFQL